MKILWFANTPCGAVKKLTGQNVVSGSWLFALSECLKSKNDIDLHIAFYWGTPIKPFRYEGITYHPILRTGGNSILGRYLYRIRELFINNENKKEIEKCLVIVKQIQPDLIHIHGTEENFGLIAEKIDNNNILLSIQGLLNPYFCKLYSGYSEYDLLKHENLVHKICFDGIKANKIRFFRKAIRESKILSLINNIVGRTTWDYSCTLALNPNRRYFIVNEILRREFLENKWEPLKEGDNFNIVSTVSSGLYKGLETIYRTAQTLKDMGIYVNWNVIGISPNDKIAKMTESILRIKSTQVGIKLRGLKNASEMVDIMLDSNVFVQVSHIENSPNSLCEAMALGMPIIATFAGGTSSIIDDQSEGVLVQDGDPFVLAGSIIENKNNPEKYYKMADKARARALSRHSNKNVLNELINTYRIVLNDK